MLVNSHTPSTFSGANLQLLTELPSTLRQLSDPVNSRSTFRPPESVNFQNFPKIQKIQKIQKILNFQTIQNCQKINNIQNFQNILKISKFSEYSENFNN
nr:MAG TPA: hypothetical protein [Caudoviricetes sp.]